MERLEREFNRLLLASNAQWPRCAVRKGDAPHSDSVARFLVRYVGSGVCAEMVVCDVCRDMMSAMARIMNDEIKWTKL